jgi:plastocyanin
MKRTIIIIAALALVMSACTKGQDIGQGLKDCGGKKCLTSIPPTAKSKTPTARPTSVKTSKPPTVTPPKNPGRTYKIVIHDNGNGFEPPNQVARVGDKIIFSNLDPNTPTGHSFTGRQHEWDSGSVKYKKSWTWIINLKPGDYYWFDQEVPYLTGGPLRVLPAA